MDKAAFEVELTQGLDTLGVRVARAVAGPLWRYQEELLKWNAKVNLTAITTPSEVLEKHFVDSLAVLPEVEGASSLLDLGAGAGLPGIPLSLACPGLSSVLVDSVEKKVTFMKTAAAAVGLAPRVRAVHKRAEGSPAAEGLTPAEVVISRAFKDLPEWLALARAYVASKGRVVGMLGRAENVESAVKAAGGTLISLRAYRLPFSGAERSVVAVAFD